MFVNLLRLAATCRKALRQYSEIAQASVRSHQATDCMPEKPLANGSFYGSESEFNETNAMNSCPVASSFVLFLLWGRVPLLNRPKKDAYSSHGKAFEQFVTRSRVAR